MRIYVGNLSYETTGDDLTSLFEQYGRVAAAQVVTDRETGRTRGFAFVEMPNPDSAKAAIGELQGAELQGRNITVTEARPREPRSAPRATPAPREPFRPRPDRAPSRPANNRGQRGQRGREESAPEPDFSDDYQARRRERHKRRKGRRGSGNGNGGYD